MQSNINQFSRQKWVCSSVRARITELYVWHLKFHSQMLSLLVNLETRLLVCVEMRTFGTQHLLSGVHCNNEHFSIILYSGVGKEGDMIFLYKYSYLSGYNVNLSKEESRLCRVLKNFNNLFMLV